MIQSDMFLIVFIFAVSVTFSQVVTQDVGSNDFNVDSNVNNNAESLDLNRNERLFEEIKKIWSYVKPAVANAILNYLNNTENGKRALDEIPNDVDLKKEEEFWSLAKPLLTQAILDDLSNKTVDKRDFEENLSLNLQMKRNLWDDIKNALKKAAIDYLKGLTTPN